MEKSSPDEPCVNLERVCKWLVEDFFNSPRSECANTEGTDPALSPFDSGPRDMEKEGAFESSRGADNERE